MKKLFLPLLLIVALTINAQDKRSRADMLVRMAYADYDKGAPLKNISALFSKASEIDAYPALYTTWAYITYQYAKEQKSDSLYQVCFDKLATASQIAPSDTSVYIVWGSMLGEYADSKKDDAIYKQSFAKFMQASLLDPTNGDIYAVWANNILNYGRMKKDVDLLRQAIDMYTKSLAINPAISYPYNGKAIAYFELGRLGKNLPTYKDEVEATLFKQEQMLSSQSAAYNLACFYSQIKDKDSAFKWLDKVFNKPYLDKMGVLSRKRFDEDKDFDHIRGDKRFKKMLDNYFPRK